MIEYLDGQYPKKAAFSAWTDKVEMVKKFKIGETITVSFNIDSRDITTNFYRPAHMENTNRWNCRSQCCKQYSKCTTSS
ncbi:MAG: DUF3127 domain-containing protein [Bacteroidetes bacterium]|nr:DUF3127 domain-containing protein [Bacteroidota bacterium]